MSTMAMAATPVQIDLETLSGETQKSVLNALKAQAKKTAPLKVNLKDITPEKINTWSVAIANGIKETSQVLNVEVNEFIKTPVGKGTAFIIFWKVVGKDLWKGIGNTILFVCFTFCINIFMYLTARWFLIPKRVKVVVDLKEGTTTEKQDLANKLNIKKEKFDDAKRVTYQGTINAFEWSDDGARECIIVIFWIVALIVNCICFANVV
jgi:hypothetical protein